MRQLTVNETAVISGGYNDCISYPLWQRAKKTAQNEAMFLSAFVSTVAGAATFAFQGKTLNAGVKAVIAVALVAPYTFILSYFNSSAENIFKNTY